MVDIPCQHIIHEYLSENDADAALSLAALTYEEHHLLPFCGGYQQIAEILLQGDHIFRCKQFQQKRHELFGIISTVSDIRVIADVQAVGAELLSWIEVAIQVELSILHMDKVEVRVKRCAVCIKPQCVHDLHDFF